MDWPHAIRRNLDALRVVVAAIGALLGGRDGAGPIARRLRGAALALLRPAEAAARRLIVMAARGLMVPLRLAAPPACAGSAGRGPGDRPPAFQLFDRLKRFPPPGRPAKPAGIPRIRTFWGPAALAPSAPPPGPPPPERPDPEALVDAARLRLRLASLERALADLPRQARRLARWRARMAAKPGGFVRSPLRPGRAPGARQRANRDIDDVLADCQSLARLALSHDTS